MYIKSLIDAASIFFRYQRLLCVSALCSLLPSRCFFHAKTLVAKPSFASIIKVIFNYVLPCLERSSLKQQSDFFTLRDSVCRDNMLRTKITHNTDHFSRTTSRKLTFFNRLLCRYQLSRQKRRVKRREFFNKTKGIYSLIDGLHHC